MCIFPFILIGKIIAKLKPQKKQYGVYFFFPFYHTGGAEMVHAQITKAIAKLGGLDAIIYFTRKSTDNRFLKAFEATGCTIKDISSFTDNKFLYFFNLIYRGIVTSYINAQQTKPVVFNGQCNFAYKISPWINAKTKQVELIHSFNSFSWIRIPFLPFISQTIMISKLRIEQHKKQYHNIGIPAILANNIQFVQNAIELPTEKCNKNFDTEINILFVGRGTPEKRPELFVKIATETSKQNMNASFTLVGEMNENLLASLPPNTTALGSIEDNSLLSEIYCKHQLLIIPSSTEGFPIVLMEAMARGCAVMATPVGDIPYHVHSNKNGWLFSSVDEKIVIAEAIVFLQSLTKEKLQNLGEIAQEYAYQNFGIELFNKSYQSLLH